jgi:hypothetical protein
MARLVNQSIDSKFQAGTNKNFAANKTLAFGGYSFTATALDAAFQRNIDAHDQSDADKLTAHASLVKAEQSEQTTAPIRAAYKAWLIAFYGPSSPTLADFGIAPKKPRRALTTEQQTVKVQKLRATREARGTLGKREKAGIHGTVNTVNAPTNGAVNTTTTK